LEGTKVKDKSYVPTTVYKSSTARLPRYLLAKQNDAAVLILSKIAGFPC